MLYRFVLCCIILYCVVSYCIVQCIFCPNKQAASLLPTVQIAESWWQPGGHGIWSAAAASYQEVCTESDDSLVFWLKAPVRHRKALESQLDFQGSRSFPEAEGCHQCCPHPQNIAPRTGVGNEVDFLGGAAPDSNGLRIVLWLLLFIQEAYKP